MCKEKYVAIFELDNDTNIFTVSGDKLEELCKGIKHIERENLGEAENIRVFKGVEFKASYTKVLTLIGEE